MSAMPVTIHSQPLTAAAFAPYGQVIQTDGAASFPINAGRCIRYHGLATVDVREGPPLINIFRSEPVTLPYEFSLVERHPLGSQAFMPLSSDPFLIIACSDGNGRPSEPHAFITAPGQGISFNRNVWHGVLTPLNRAASFLVVDRGGKDNLEEFRFGEAFRVE
ncbi:MAG: ureidoglycolate lyase [Aestuariivirga sp.]